MKFFEKGQLIARKWELLFNCELCPGFGGYLVGIKTNFSLTWRKMGIPMDYLERYINEYSVPVRSISFLTIIYFPYFVPLKTIETLIYYSTIIRVKESDKVFLYTVLHISIPSISRHKCLKWNLTGKENFCLVKINNNDKKWFSVSG